LEFNVSARLEFVPFGLQPDLNQIHPQPNSVGANRRSIEPIDVLSRKMDEICIAAVSPLEIAAALEMDGINDRSSREIYGYDDIFALAEALYCKVPFRQKSQPLPKQEKVSLVVVFRGLLYAFPGLMMAGFGLTNANSSYETGLTVTAGLVFGSIFAWAWSQGMARLGYIKLGQSAPRQAGRSLLLGLGVGTILVSVLSSSLQLGLGLFDGVMPVIAMTQTLYSLTAVVLFTLDRPNVLFYFVGPGLAIAFLRWDGVIDLQTTLICAAIWLVSLLVYTMVIAFQHGQKTKAVKVHLFTLSEWIGAVPFVLQGTFSALLLAFNALMSLYGVVTGQLPPSGYAILPLVLSMGFSELELGRYRAAMNHLLHITSDLDQFRIGAQRVFAASLGRNCLVLTVFLAISGVIGGLMLGSLSESLVIVLLEGLLLGVGFFASFILVAHNRVADAVLCTALAVLVRLWLLLVPIDLIGIVNLAQSELIAAAVFAIATLAIARMIVGRLGTLG
jgi:hypothetical protein